MALFLREKNLEFLESVLALLDTTLLLSAKNAATIIPGYTHHQHAMVTTLGHVFFSFSESSYRDLLRFKQWHTLFNVNPLGGAAGYGTSFPLDRELTSMLLGFDKASSSSLDPVTNRWESEAELGCAISMTMNHLSGLAQTLILFTTTEFGFVTLSDKYCGGSSIMPQKRNPGGLEVIKAKTALVQGILGSLLSLGRGVLVGYNRDSQWSKYLIMDALEESGAAPRIMAAILDTLSIDEQRAKDLCQRGFITATDLMEALVSEFAIPLREGKVLVEKAVKYSEAEGRETVSYEALDKALKEMDLQLSVSPDSVRNWQEPAPCVNRRKAIGGPAPEVVEEAVKALTAHVQKTKEWLQEKSNQIQSAKNRLEEIEKELLHHKP
jgi:argininosuccinate lyase